MGVKIFQAGGHSEINDMEYKINAWLRETQCEVVDISTAMRQIGYANEGERYQQLAVTILYRDRNSN